MKPSAAVPGLSLILEMEIHFCIEHPLRQGLLQRIEDLPTLQGCSRVYPSQQAIKQRIGNTGLFPRGASHLSFFPIMPPIHRIPDSPYSHVVDRAALLHSATAPRPQSCRQRSANVRRLCRCDRGWAGVPEPAGLNMSAAGYRCGCLQPRRHPGVRCDLRNRSTPQRDQQDAFD